VDVVRNSVNRGFAAAVNQAFQVTSSSYVLILNPDLRAMPGAIRILEEFLDDHPRVGAIGGYVGDKYLPKRLPSAMAFVRQNFGWREKLEAGDRSHNPVPVEQPAAAALMVLRDAYDEVGGFDEQFFPAWYEDVDFCRRLRDSGWEIYFARNAEFLHEGGYSADEMGTHRFLHSYYSNQLRYARKHFGALGAAAVRTSIAIGMFGRMISRPKEASAYGKVFLRSLKGL
jgi:GT2 family glycosyltransferase